MNKKRKIKNLILSFLLIAIISIFSVISLPYVKVNANAVNIGYSNVLDDLKKDSNFDISKYPDVATDYSVKLLTIAESDYNELFLYVYQPSDATLDFTCVKASIHIGFSVDGQDLNPTPYNLKLVSTSGVFDKYLVQDFVAPDDNCHYFNIVALYRNSNTLVDNSIAGTTSQENAFNVGEQWCCYAVNGVMHYEKSTFKTVSLKPTFHGSVNSKNNTFWNKLLGINEGRKVLFLSFNVENFVAEKIYDANVDYKYHYVKKTVIDSSADFTGQYPLTSYKYSDSDDNNSFKSYTEEPWFDKKVKLSEKQEHSYSGTGLLAKTFTWKEISTSKVFLENCSDTDFDNEAYDKIKNSEYVFCYADYGYNSGSYSDTSQGMPSITYTTTWDSYAEYKDLTVLTLRFLDAKEGELNLGVVCDISTPDNIDDGERNANITLEEFMTDNFKLLASLLAVILLVVFLWPFISPFITILIKTIIKGFVIVLKFIFKVGWFVIAFPWNIIFKKRKRY